MHPKYITDYTRTHYYILAYIALLSVYKIVLYYVWNHNLSGSRLNCNSLDFIEYHDNGLVAMETDSLSSFSHKPLTFLLSLVPIGPKTSE